MCEQNTLTRHIFSVSLRSRCVARTSSHVSSALCCLLDILRLFHSAFLTIFPIFHLILLVFTFNFHVDWFEGKPLCALPQMRSSLTPLSTQPLSQVLSPNSSTTTTSRRPLKLSARSPPATPSPRYLHDSEISDDTTGRAFSSPLFTQEREEPAGHTQAYHSPEESLSSSQSSSVGHRTGRPVEGDQFDSLPNVRESPCRGSEN